MDILKTAIPILSYVLITAFLLAFLAHWHWSFALFTHFNVQYIVGALIFLPFLVFLNHDLFLSLCMIIVAAISFAQTRLPMAKPWQFSPPPIIEDSETLKVAQYNKYHKNHPYKELLPWLEQNKIDLLIMQELGKKEIEQFKKELGSLLPFSPPSSVRIPGHAMIFSKYKLENLQVKKVCQKLCETSATRFEITLPQEQKITVFSVHADTPLFKGHYDRQSEELLQTGRWINKEKTDKTIFIGDINTSPYSPNFRKLLDVSGLRYQNYSVLPETTWPSFMGLSFLRIPIDHILFSDDLNLTHIKQDQSHGSDHHSLIATFTIK